MPLASVAIPNQKEQNLVEKVLFSGNLKGSTDFYELQEVVERWNEIGKTNSVHVEIDVEVSAGIRKVLPAAPSVGIFIVAPDGSNLYSQEKQISDKDWLSATSSGARAIFRFDISKPPDNSMVRVYHVNPKDGQARVDWNRCAFWDAAMYLDNPYWTPATGRSSSSIATGGSSHFENITYEKYFPRYRSWPEDISSSKIVQRKKLSPKEELAILNHLPEPEPSFEPANPDVRQTLMSYYVVPVYEWQNCYSHVALMDRVGDIILPNGARIVWLLRPGGLAYITYPDGGAVYLAQQLTDSRMRSRITGR